MYYTYYILIGKKRCAINMTWWKVLILDHPEAAKKGFQENEHLWVLWLTRSFWKRQHLKFLDLATLTPDPLPHSHEALCVAACCCHEILQSTFCQGHQHLEGSMEGAKKKLSDQYSQYHQYHPSSLLLYSDFIRSFRAHCFLLCFEEKVHIQGKTVDFSSIPCN